MKEVHALNALRETRFLFSHKEARPYFFSFLSGPNIFFPADFPRFSGKQGEVQAAPSRETRATEQSASRVARLKNAKKGNKKCFSRLLNFAVNCSN